MDILKPLGLAPEDVKLPLSPRSEDAYARINEEFDMLYSQLQDPGEQAGQNHAEVTCNCMLPWQSPGNWSHKRAIRIAMDILKDMRRTVVSAACALQKLYDITAVLLLSLGTIVQL